MVATAAPPWVADVVAEWRPRARLGGSEWADRERVLSPEESPAPGPWKSVPWQVEILDAFADPYVAWIVILKAAQMGVSELVRNAIGRWALLDPGDVLWVMATEDAARKAMKKLRAMFRSTPALRGLVSDRRTDSTLLEMVLLNGMRIVIGWAGSAQSLASDPFRYVILDEVGKYRWSTQGEASAIDLAKERTKVYGRRGKVILLSSPKHDDDPICTAHREVPRKRVFAVPCPTCHHVAPLDWTRVRWPGGEPATAPSVAATRASQADEIERAQSGWVACAAAGCSGKITPHLAMRDRLARYVDEGDPGPGRRVAYHVPEFFHWETTISDLVAKFLRCTTPSALQGFYNGSLGLAYRSETSLIPAGLFLARAGFKARLVPSWATTVISTADTQAGGWWFMVRAWGSGGRSRLLDWGWAPTQEELLARCLNVSFAVEGAQSTASPIMLAIDSGGGMQTPDGSRTGDVYDLARTVRRVYALKGEGEKEALQGVPWRITKVHVTADNFGDVEIPLHMVNKTFYADQLATLVRAVGPVLWEECETVDNTYARQMASEQKVLVTGAAGSKWLWQKRSKGAENHLWDCARYQCWAAEFCRAEERQTMWTGRPVSPRRAREDDERRPGWVIGRG